MQYLTIRNSLGKHLISLPESIDIKLNMLLINGKPFSISPDVIYNQYLIKEKIIPRAKKIIFVSKGKNYSADYLLLKGNVVFKNGGAGFGMISSANGIVKNYFFNELYPDIDNIIKNRYLITMRNYSWLFVKFEYERTALKKKTDLTLFTKYFPEFFISTTFGIINKCFVEYSDIASLYHFFEEDQPNLNKAKDILNKYNCTKNTEQFANLKKDIVSFIDKKPREVVSFIRKTTLNI
jgi:hypothetical protein